MPKSKKPTNPTTRLFRDKHAAELMKGEIESAHHPLVSRVEVQPALEGRLAGKAWVVFVYWRDGGSPKQVRKPIDWRLWLAVH
jgi:hypothetical protein